MDLKIELQKFQSLDVIIVCGLQGSGKSHFAENYFKGTGRQRINRTEIRKFLFEMMNFGEEWQANNFKEKDELLVKNVERRIYDHFLSHNEKILIDNTSVTIESRKKYIDTARISNKTIGAIMIKPPIQICMQRNKQKKSPIPEMVISSMFAKMVEPSVREGFKYSMTINNY